MSQKKQNQSKKQDHFSEMFRQINEYCEKQEYLAGRLQQHNSQLRIELPESLPSSLLIRAIGKQKQQYEELTDERVATQPDNPLQLGLRLDGLQKDQLSIFIRELNELIGEFTARS